MNAYTWAFIPMTFLMTASLAYAQQCQSLDPVIIANEPEVQASLDRAWIDSEEGSESEHEEGFYVYHCRMVKPAVCPEQYEYTTEIDHWPSGSRESVTPVPIRTDSNCRLVLSSHTHPGVGRYSPFSNDVFSNNFPSDSDELFVQGSGIPSLIRWGRGRSLDNTQEFIVLPDRPATPNWTCADATPPPTSACSVDPAPTASLGPAGSSFGDPHLTTFDGYFYTFQSIGEFMLAQSADKIIDVQSRQVPFGSSKSVAVNDAVVANIAGDIVEINRLGSITPDLLINNSMVIMNTVDSLTLPGGGTIERELGKYTMIWPDGSFVKAGSHNIIIRLAAIHKDNMHGLLGNYDSNRNNELIDQGSDDPPEEINHAFLHGIYADSWRVLQSDSLFTYPPGESTETYTDKSFPEIVVSVDSFTLAEQTSAEQICRERGVSDPLLIEACIIDVLSTGDTTFADSAAEVQQTLQEELVTTDLSSPSSGNTCPCADVFTAYEMDVPPWAINSLRMLTVPAQGCTISNGLSFLDHESMTLDDRKESQRCSATVGSSNFNSDNVVMTDEQYDACLDIIEGNAREWFANGHTLEISRNFQSAVPVNSIDEISCLR